MRCHKGELLGAIQDALDPSLLLPAYRKDWSRQNPTYGFCSLASEAAWFLLRECGWPDWTAYYAYDETGGTHWWLESETEIFDPTMEQYLVEGREPPHEHPSKKACGFSGSRRRGPDQELMPSTRAMQLIRRIDHPAAYALVARDEQLRRHDRNAMVRTAATLVAYHGTATGKDNQILESILANGLVQNQEDRPYGGIGEDDYLDDAHASYVVQLDESFEGVYLTNRFGEAERYAKNAVLHYGGDRLYVVARIDTNQGAYIDEDLLFGPAYDFAHEYLYNITKTYVYYEILGAAEEDVDWRELAMAYLDDVFGIETISAEGRRDALPALAEAIKARFFAEYLHQREDDIDYGEMGFPDEYLGDYHEYAAEAIEALSELALPRGNKHNVRVPAVPYNGPTRILAVVEQDADRDYVVHYEAEQGLAARYLP